MKSVTHQMLGAGGSNPWHITVFVRDIHRPNSPLPERIQAACIRFGSLLTFTYTDGPLDQQKVVEEICVIVERWLSDGYGQVTFVGDLLTYEVIKELKRRNNIRARIMLSLILLDAFKGAQAESSRQDPKPRDKAFEDVWMASIQPERDLDLEDNPSMLWASAVGHRRLRVIPVRGGTLDEDPAVWANALIFVMGGAFS